jgi:glycosyltransferase involved in cell wall biosynthesis
MLVSVLINNYNYAQYLDECINSILNQTYPYIEVIFYDDKSKDNSINVAEKYADKIKIIKGNEKFDYPSFNQGNAINKAFQMANGEVICLLDSDDYFELTKVEKVVNIFKNNLDVVLVQHALYETCNDKITNKYDNAIYNADYNNLYQKYRYTSFYNPTSALSFRRNYFKMMLPLKVDDYWRVWPDVRLARPAPYFGRVYSINKCLGYYRKHNLNDSSSMNSKPLYTIKNHISHHKYLNLFLSKNNFTTVNYYSSRGFIINLIKCIIPNILLNLVINNKYLLLKTKSF